jgi:hypothetical protein
MNKDDLDSFFETQKNKFDIEEPSAIHKALFLEKLKTKDELLFAHKTKQRRSLYISFFGIAASILLIVTLNLNPFSKEENLKDLASVSPEMAKTKNFFTVAISEELYKLKKESIPEAKILILDTTKRLNTLEEAYENLKKDLNESGNDKRVIFAMITNFQMRIEILKTTLQKIDHIKQLKTASYDTNSTI